MTMPDWPSLWEREPALRPQGLGVVSCGDFTHSDIAAVGDYGYDAVAYFDTSSSLSAALCRDAAVRWLANHRPFVLHGYEPVEKGAWALRFANSPQALPFSDTLDAALFAACKAVLDARDAAKEKP